MVKTLCYYIIRHTRLKSDPTIIVTIIKVTTLASTPAGNNILFIKNTWSNFGIAALDAQAF